MVLFPLHAFDLDSISSMPYGPQSLQGLISECRVLGVAPSPAPAKKMKYKFKEIQI